MFLLNIKHYVYNIHDRFNNIIFKTNTSVLESFVAGIHACWIIIFTNAESQTSLPSAYFDMYFMLSNDMVIPLMTILMVLLIAGVIDTRQQVQIISSMAMTVSSAIFYTFGYVIIYNGTGLNFSMMFFPMLATFCLMTSTVKTRRINKGL